MSLSMHISELEKCERNVWCDHGLRPQVIFLCDSLLVTLLDYNMCVWMQPATISNTVCEETSRTFD